MVAQHSHPYLKLAHNLLKRETDWSSNHIARPVLAWPVKAMFHKLNSISDHLKLDWEAACCRKNIVYSTIVITFSMYTGGAQIHVWCADILWHYGKRALWLRTQEGWDHLDDSRQIGLSQWRADIQDLLHLISLPTLSFSASSADRCHGAGTFTLSRWASLGCGNRWVLMWLERPLTCGGRAISSMRSCLWHQDPFYSLEHCFLCLPHVLTVAHVLTHS